MVPRNSRNTTAPLLPHVTVGLHVANTTSPLLAHGAVALHSPTAETTLNLKRMYNRRRSKLSPLSRASLASSSLLTMLLCFSPTFPRRRCAPLLVLWFWHLWRSCTTHDPGGKAHSFSGWAAVLLLHLLALLLATVVIVVVYVSVVALLLSQSPSSLLRCISCGRMQ